MLRVTVRSLCPLPDNAQYESEEERMLDPCAATPIDQGMRFWASANHHDPDMLFRCVAWRNAFHREYKSCTAPLVGPHSHRPERYKLGEQGYGLSRDAMLFSSPRPAWFKLRVVRRRKQTQF